MAISVLNKRPTSNPWIRRLIAMALGTQGCALFVPAIGAAMRNTLGAEAVMPFRAALGMGYLLGAALSLIAAAYWVLGDDGG